MAKNLILEAISEIIDEEISQMFSEDTALDMSNKHREEFLKAVQSNPPAHNSRGHIKEAGILPDKPTVNGAGNQNAPPEGDNTPVDASPDFGAPMTAGAPGGSTSDMSAAIGAGGAGPTGAPADDGTDTLGSPEDAPENGDTVGGDSGGAGVGGGLGSGFGGGGGGGGGGGDMGLDDSGEGGEGADTGKPPEPEPSYDPFKDAKSTEDKLQVILDTAEGIAAKTQNPQAVVKAIKGLIQNGFSDPDKAAKIIAQLFDTDNPVLQQVSRRLGLYLRGI